MKMAFTLAVLLCLYTPAVAAELYATPEPPAQLVEAIALQESGLNPFTVNIAGRSYYPATREKAKQLIQKAIAAGLSFDVGKMQINSWWMERYGIDPLSLLDPAINESWGTWILAEEIARYGLNWKAVGKYHSPDPERGRRYAWLVYRHYAGLRASKIQEAPCAEQKIDSYLTPEEHAQIRASASKAGLSLSTFSKRVCLGFSVPSLEHQEARIELRRLKGDLGRLGGLVKQALANGADRLTVHRLLHELDVRQREVQQAIAGIR